MNNQTTPHRVGKSGLVIFDGSCGACSAFIGEKEAFFEKYGFSVAPLQDPWVQEIVNLNEETLLQAIHLYTPEGEIVRGIDFFQRGAGKIWWLTPLNLLLQVPILKRVFAVIYDAVAKRRRRISQLCGLQSRARYSKRSKNRIG